MAATHTTTATDLLEAPGHAASAPHRDWDWIDRLLDDLLEVQR